jgi:hypothetical protein
MPLKSMPPEISKRDATLTDISAVNEPELKSDLSTVNWSVMKS